MTATLKELLTEYAEQARPYEVREQALRRGRRRRRMRVAMPASLALLTVVATGLTVVVLRPHATGPQPPTDQPSLPTYRPEVVIDPDDLERANLPGYPAEIVTDPDAPPLPADRTVGHGLRVYTNPDGPWFGLVTRTGEQYRLDPPGEAAVSLSPQGRWLLRFTDDDPSTVRLRDLGSTAVATLPGPGTPSFARWWSIDDRWLLTSAIPAAPQPERPVPPKVVSLTDLSQPTPTPQEIDLGPWPGFAPVAVRTDGTLVLRSISSDRLGDFVLVDPATGDGRPVSIDLSVAATPNELATMASEQSLFALGGFTTPLGMTEDGFALLHLAQTFGELPHEVTSPTDVLVLDLDAGTVRERWNLPEPYPICEDVRLDWESWRVEAVLPEGLLLTHRNTQRVLAWELYDPATGELSLVTDLRGLASAHTDLPLCSIPGGQPANRSTGRPATSASASA